MIYKIVYNPDATLDLICIKAYIKYALKNPKAADKIWGNINKAISLLDFSPKRYAIAYKLSDNLEVHRMPVEKYNIYYSVDDENQTITIHNIVYSGVDINQIAN